MIKIINNPNPRIKEEIITCEVCQCEFSFNPVSDTITESYNNGILGPGAYGYTKTYVVCPNCGSKISLYENNTSRGGDDHLIPPCDGSDIRGSIGIRLPRESSLEDLIDDHNRAT